LAKIALYYAPEIDRQVLIMNKSILEILVSPLSKTPLVYREKQQELWSRVDKLAFPIREGIPVMLVEEARSLTPDELSELKHG
jgi:uncharacterized protein YbaR (Trm112 family)